MSVTQPIQLGRLRMTPQHFESQNVTVMLEYAGDPIGEDIPMVAVHDAASGGNAGPTLPIVVWESLQQAARDLERLATR